MSKAWSLRYALTRLRYGWEETLSQLRSTTATVPDAIHKGVEAYYRELTTVICMSGAAMAPGLNPKAASHPAGGAVDSLLLRCIPRPSMRSVFEDDVVAFTSPLAHPDAQNVLVRRVAAMEGAEMLSDDPQDESFKIPSGAGCFSSMLREPGSCTLLRCCWGVTDGVLWASRTLLGAG